MAPANFSQILSQFRLLEKSCDQKKRSRSLNLLITFFLINRSSWKFVEWIFIPPAWFPQIFSQSRSLEKKLQPFELGDPRSPKARSLTLTVTFFLVNRSSWKFQKSFFMPSGNFWQIFSQFRSLEKKLDDEEVVEDTSFAHKFFSVWDIELKISGIIPHTSSQLFTNFEPIPFTRKKVTAFWTWWPKVT